MVHSYLITLGGYNVGCAVKLVVITSVVTFCAQSVVTFSGIALICNILVGFKK